MGKNPSHWGDAEFEDFVAKELDELADRATTKDICFGCLSDRLIYEVVGGLIRNGLSPNEILGIVQDALDDAEEDDQTDPPTSGRSHRMH